MANQVISKVRLIAVGIACLATLQGCSVFSVGESEYSCSGIPEGVRCMSARDVYELTNNGNVPRPVDEEGNPIPAAGEPSGSADEETQTRVIEDRYVAPSTPSKPVPIRTPATVMRVLITPWEDTDGNLNISNYVYTEIEPRRWAYDNQARPESQAIQPLQMIQKQDPRESGSSKGSAPRTDFFSGPSEKN